MICWKQKKVNVFIDLGCGTGDLAWKLYELGADVVGIDKSENMINQAKTKYPGLTFEVKDVLNLGYRNEFDAVFSNAVLHWIKPPKQALINIYQALKENGRFVAEFGGKGNVQTITDAIRNEFNQLGMNEKANQFPWYFPSIGEYSSLMEEAGFRVVLAQHFDRPTPLHGENGLKNWIEMFAGSLFNDVADDTKSFIITNIENKLKNTLFQNGKWLADYKRIRVIGMKE
ncbi:class I SAM-dependent methyltransferase [Aeribacillus composti]|uniref:class I SAM-dependent methyltransferase n=1 Tax=Aeribacillus composti TaxID=1868734 RepID=UPI002E1C54F1|nr:class I SAM-dependent methyltransferase [Aeribacillus composti]